MWGKHTQPLMEINEPSLAGASMPLVPASIVGLPPLADALPFAGTEAPPVAGLPLYLTGAWFALAHKPPVPPRFAQQSWATLAPKSEGAR